MRRRVWFASHRTFLTWSASKSSCIVKRTSTPDCSSCDRSAEDRYDRTAWVFRVEKANTPMYDRLVSVTLVASTTPLWNHLPVPQNKLWLASRFHSDGSVPLALDLCSTTLEPRFASPTGTIVQSCTQGPCWFVKGSFSRTSRPHVLRSSAYKTSGALSSWATVSKGSSEREGCVSREIRPERRDSFRKGWRAHCPCSDYFGVWEGGLLGILGLPRKPKPRHFLARAKHKSQLPLVGSRSLPL